MKRRIMCILLALSLLLSLTPQTLAEENNGPYPDGTVKFNGNYYKIYDEIMTWTEAKIQCEELGGRLVTITSQSEMDFLIRQLANAQKNCYWIGMKYWGNEGRWQLVTGTSTPYFNWAQDEPNSLGKNDQDYVYLYGKPYVYQNITREVGEWANVGNDSVAFTGSFNSLENFGYICEWGDESVAEADDLVEREGHYYQLYCHAKTWEDAEKYCVSVGGHLATITSAGENDFLHQFIVSRGVSNAYFGLSDAEQEGTWKWVTGELLDDTYKNWVGSEPNAERSNEDYAMFYYKFAEGDNKGGWNDGNYGQGTVGDNFPVYFICEWDQKPTGDDLVGFYPTPPSDHSHDTIEDLTEEDYLALSKISYWDFDEYLGNSMKQALIDMGQWDNVLEPTDIKYSELCEAIGHWKVVDVDNYSNINGFYGVTFANGEDAVVAYRGSIPLDGPDAWLNVDSIYDWVCNDVYPILWDRISTKGQYKSAMTMYENARKDYTNIAVTGHSLGGGLTDIISAIYGCKGVSMNAISILDAFYANFPELFGSGFAGVDKWNFLDHANQYDLMAGAFEINVAPLFATKLKPVITHEADGDFSLLDVINYHSLGSFITRDADGTPTLTDKTDAFIPNDTISNRLSVARFFFDNSAYLDPFLEMGISIDLGTSDNNSINKGLFIDTKRVSYGGDGHDTISTYIWADTIIGGRGSDDLDGTWGNDTYYYHKGDDVDTIHDIGGNDKVVLMGFDEDDTFSVEEDPDSDYICITNGGEDIVRISKENREYILIDTNRFKIVLDRGNDSRSEIFDISDAFSVNKYGQHLYIGCPVHVEVLDPDGNVVFTLVDGETGNWYNDYGNFYVFKEENGEYGKVLDLVEGYTARIVGADEGTMDVTYQVPVDGVLTDPISVSGVPVTEDLTATIEETEDGNVYLVIDENGDGQADSERRLCGECPFTDVPKDSFYYEPVVWAVKEGITSGATETTYNPGGTCLRAQVVTFLHRADGNPQPTSTRNPFTDVKSGDFFYQPVLWAVEKGITNGTTATTFGSYANCNRAAVVTFLWRAAGEPEPVSTDNPFTDVNETDFFYKPVLWAVENGITAGIDATHFGPTTDCNRAQVVTFLYRAYN